MNYNIYSRFSPKNVTLKQITYIYLQCTNNYMYVSDFPFFLWFGMTCYCIEHYFKRMLNKSLLICSKSKEIPKIIIDVKYSYFV